METLFSPYLLTPPPITSTGKSLVQSIWGRVFHGDDVKVMTSVTENAAHSLLAKGQSIYGKDFLFIIHSVIYYELFAVS